MEMPKFEGKISLGNLIQIVLLLVTLGSLWTTITEKQDQLHERIIKIEERIRVELLRADVQSQRDLIMIEKLRAMDMRLERIERKIQ